MSIRHLLIVLAVASAAGGGSYAATRAVRTTNPAKPTQPASSATDTLLDWLAVPSAQRAEIRQHDPSFAADLKQLREALADQRSQLATTLENTAASDKAITERVEAVIAANAKLERRITQYLLEVRPYLSADQQQKLFGLCAEGVRQGSGWCLRRGQGGGGGGGWGAGGGGGRGYGPGGGRGRNGWREE